MNVSSYTASARALQGPAAVSRRHAMSSIAALALVGPSVAAAEAGEGATSEMSHLIDAHREAAAAYRAIATKIDEASGRFAARLKREPVTCQLLSGNIIAVENGSNFYENIIFSESADSIKQALARRMGAKSGKDLRIRLDAILAIEEANLDALRVAHVKFTALQDAFGLRDLDDEFERASDVEIAAFQDLLSARPTSFRENTARFDYLADYLEREGYELTDTQNKMLFVSMMSLNPAAQGKSY